MVVMVYIPATWEADVEGSWPKATLSKSMKVSKKQKQTNWGQGKCFKWWSNFLAILKP
jgi:hypothetical protein